VQSPLDFSFGMIRPSDGSEKDVHVLGKARALLAKCPGFFFSTYSQTAFFSSALMRDDQMGALLNMSYEYAGITPVEPLPYQKLMIRTLDSASTRQREDVINALRYVWRTYVLESHFYLLNRSLAGLFSSRTLPLGSTLCR